MFKPHYGYCKFCDKDDQLIVVKSGHCQKCNYEQKQSKKKAAGKKTGKYKYIRKATGEKETFGIVLDNLPDVETRCFACGNRVPVVTHNNMAHVLSKKQFERFRNNPENIVILCHRYVADENGNQGCHYRWDMTPRSHLTEPYWKKLFELEEKLKEEYKSITDL